MISGLQWAPMRKNCLLSLYSTGFGGEELRATHGIGRGNSKVEFNYTLHFRREEPGQRKGCCSPTGSSHVTKATSDTQKARWGHRFSATEASFRQRLWHKEIGQGRGTDLHNTMLQHPRVINFTQKVWSQTLIPMETDTEGWKSVRGEMRGEKWVWSKCVVYMCIFLNK